LTKRSALSIASVMSAKAISGSIMWNSPSEEPARGDRHVRVATAPDPYAQHTLVILIYHATLRHLDFHIDPPTSARWPAAVTLES